MQKEAIFTLVVALTVGLFPSMAADGAPSQEVHAVFSYSGPSAVTGSFTGSCEATGLDPGARPLVLYSEGGVLVVRYTRVNYTVIDRDFMMEHPDAQWVERHSVPAGMISVAWPSTGLGLALPAANARPSPVEPFTAELDLSRLNASSAEAAPISRAVRIWLHDGSDDPPESRVATYSGWARMITYEGDVRIHGNASFYLREARIESTQGETVLGPYRTETANVSSPVVSRRTLVFEDAFLDVRGVDFLAPPGSQLACRHLGGQVVGAFVADQASGVAEGRSGSISFSDRVVSFEGSFDLEENPREQRKDAAATGWMDSTADGDVRVMGIDFVPVSSDPSPIPIATLGLWAVLGLALVVLVKNMGSLVGAFYSRVERGGVLDNSRRDLVYQAVVQNPGLDISRLAKLTPLHFTTVAYHIQVLARVGLVATLRHGRSVRVLPQELLNQEGLPAVLMAHDPHLAFVAERVRAGPVLLAALARAVADRWGLERRASYRVVERAVQARIVEKVPGVGREQMIRCRV